MKVKIHHLVAVLQELQSIKVLTPEQANFKAHVTAVIDYIETSDDFHQQDTVVEFY